MEISLYVRANDYWLCKTKESHSTNSTWNWMKLLKVIILIIKILQLKNNHGNHKVSRCPNQCWSPEDLEWNKNPSMGALWSKNCHRKVFSLWTKNSKSMKTNIWYSVFSSPRVSKSIMTWKNTLQWELFEMFEEQSQELPQKGFSPWTNTEIQIFGHLTFSFVLKLEIKWHWIKMVESNAVW